MILTPTVLLESCI